ncbi:hypothetical protein C447_00120 [Halococcus hamelinensis 100A6]|uniref:Uncharacterized protein n=1 Tax=Halococcus hamelinensis 100A6 TaxID=1132509 RepID=M0M9D3_9EURY|nr:hypothetical protein C447_00120 [Halococcus hamelinensis 100A6]
MAHTYGDERIAEWLRENEYHPRSSKHGSVSCLALLDDLLYESDLFREAAEAGEIVYEEDYTVGEGELRWNVDLVLGPPTNEVETPIEGDRQIAEANPEEIWLAIDAKSVMTEHQKARRNRQRDINGFADIMYHHYPGAVAGGVLLINIADQFRSPLRDEGDITEHDNIERLVEETIEIFRTIDRSEGEIDPNVDAAATVVVDHTNLDDDHETQLVEDPPAPGENSIVNYRTFLSIIVETFEERFLIGDPPNMATLREADTLRNELNEQVVELLHYVHEVGVTMEQGEVSEDSIEDLRETLGQLEDLVDGVEQRHAE